MRLRFMFVALACGLSLLSSACDVVRPGSGAPDYGRVGELVAESPVRRAKQSTVRIRNLGCGAVSTGTGVVVAPDVLLTNAHVIAGAEDIEITLWDGETLDATVFDATITEDLATIRVGEDLTEGHTAETAEFATEDPMIGARLMVVGYPEGGIVTATSGEALRYADLADVNSLVMTNEVKPGNSGGPVFDAAGRVVGIVRALLDTGEGVAIPVSTVQPAVDDLSSRQGGDVPPCGSFAPFR